MAHHPYYSPGEEIANSITHGIGTLLAIAGLSTMVAFAASRGTALHVTSCSIFGATLVISYLCSTLYHSITHPTAKGVLRTLDHAAIFLLIAGTYTPITLVTLNGAWGWTLFGLVWGCALIGILLETLASQRLAAFSLLIYLLMGWTVVIAARPMFRAMAPGGLVLLVAGGLIYSLGVIFYSWKKVPYNHAIWHLFVLGGSILHFFSILFYVIPATV